MAAVERRARAERHVGDGERLRLLVAVGGGARQHAAVGVADGHEAIARAAGQRGAGFDRAGDGHAPVQPAVAAEVPGRHEQEARAAGGVRAADVDEVHVLADGHAEARLAVEETDGMAGRHRLDDGDEVDLVVR